MSGRSYVVGLPVIITVEDDGSVCATVDLSEAADINPEHTCEGQPTDEATIAADEAAIIAALDRDEVGVAYTT